MMGMQVGSRWGQVARGWSAALVATTTAAVSHTLAGGAAPSLVGLVAAVIISGSLSTALVGRRLSVVRLAAAMGLSQLLFHWLFVSLGAPVVFAHTHGAATALPDATAGHHASTMWLAHAAAGLVALVVYRYGEAAFFALADTAALLVARVTRVLVPAPVSPVAPSLPAWAPHAPRARLLLDSTQPRRGPPLAAASA